MSQVTITIKDEEAREALCSAISSDSEGCYGIKCCECPFNKGPVTLNLIVSKAE